MSAHDKMTAREAAEYGVLTWEEDDPCDCPVCGDWRDAPDASCAACGYFPHEHRSSMEADRGGAMDSKCIDCGAPIARRGYGSFVGPWEQVITTGPPR